MPFSRAAVSVLILAFFAPRQVQAADTLEVFDTGATDIEFYTGTEGEVDANYPGTVYGNFMLGYGLLPVVSAYLNVVLSGEDHLSSSTTAFCVGLFGTPLNTDHADLDLILDFGADSVGESGLRATPGVEINVDLVPDLELAGIYLRFGERIGGVVEDPDETAQPSGDVPTGTVASSEVRDTDCKFESELVLGVYLTLGERHQLLLEFDTFFAHTGDREEDDPHVGGIALGYNVLVVDTLELITQVYFDVPQEGESFGLGVMLGLISTLPNAR